MDQDKALKSFSALAHEARLAILHLLIGTGSEGLSAGVIGAQVSVLASRLSFHLNVLEQAGLVTSQRKSRNVIYAADYAALRRLTFFLMRDCCRDHPDICGNLQNRPPAGSEPRPSRVAP